jgi:hypothetical protein
MADIDNDTLFSAFKMKLLGAILLPVAGAPFNSNGDYCSGDDLKAVLKLIIRKLATILVAAGSSNLDEMYDSLAIVITLMASMKLSGITSAESDLLMERISSFNDSSMQKMRKFAGLVNDYGEYIPMKAKNMYIH